MSKRVYITVDMETPQTPLKQGKIKENVFDYQYEYGAILNICHFFNIPVTYFLNIYEEGLWGEGFFEDKCKDILDKGGDIQLHTHPCWQYDMDRINMYDYSLNEQIDIISMGKKRLEEITGQNIKIHRAGAYGADFNTLNALRESDIHLDSSFFYGHSNCKLNQYTQEELVNTKIRQVEILVFESGLKYDNRILKFDIDWMDLSELMGAITIIIQHELDNIILFMHSSSFIRWRDEYSKLEPDYYKLYKFIKVIEYFIDSGYEFSKIKDISDIPVAESWKHRKVELEKVACKSKQFIKQLGSGKWKYENCNSEIIRELTQYMEKSKYYLQKQVIRESIYHFCRNQVMTHKNINQVYEWMKKEYDNKTFL